jgi:peptide/nickel transport system permease protein
MSPLLLDNLVSNLPPLLIIILAVIVYRRAKTQPLWSEAFRRLRRNKVAMASILVIGLYAAIALADTFGWQPTKVDDRKTIADHIFARQLEQTYSPPFGDMSLSSTGPKALNAPRSHPLGTDGIGEDVLYKTVKGVRTAFIIGGLTSLIAIPLALALGLLGGYFGKRVDDVVQYVYTVFASVPDVLLLIATIIILGRGLVSMCLALGITSWVALCRLVRGETLKHREREYVRAAKALGVSSARLLTRHILPNLLPSIIIAATIGFSGLILAEAILSFLGVGVGPEVGSWGNMIDAARDELTRDPIVWWDLVAATAALLVLVLSINVLADALRDAIDPRLRTE